MRRLAVVVAGGAIVASVVAGILLARRDMTPSNIAGGASNELAEVDTRSSRPIAGLSL